MITLLIKLNDLWTALTKFDNIKKEEWSHLKYLKYVDRKRTAISEKFNYKATLVKDPFWSDEIIMMKGLRDR